MIELSVVLMAYVAWSMTLLSASSWFNENSSTINTWAVVPVNGFVMAGREWKQRPDD